jgi:predicted transglutaminase-like cysteine proteinase
MVLALALAGTAAQASEPRASSTGLLPVREVAGPPPGAVGLCSTYGWACAKSGKRTTVDARALETMKTINARVNRTVRPVADTVQYRRAENWSLPTARGGDCEDYALLKKKELIAAGFAPEQLLIATVLDRRGRSHAVLVVRTGRQDLVLDNLTGRILPWQQTGYTFLRLQNPARPAGWVAVLAGGIFQDDAVANVARP